MTETRQSIALRLLSGVPSMSPGTAWHVTAKYRGALLNAARSILTLPNDVTLPLVEASPTVCDVRFLWLGDRGGGIVATFTDVHGYKLSTPGSGGNSVRHEDGHWLLDALRNAGYTQHKPVVREGYTGIRALEME